MTQSYSSPARRRAAAPHFSALHLIACMVFIVCAGTTVAAEDVLEPRPPVFDVEPTIWEFGVYTGGHITDKDIFHELGLAGVYNTKLFRMSFDFAARNDDKYVSAEPNTMLGYKFDFREGMVQLNLTPVTLTGGRVQHRDEVATPYSLFISSWAPASIILEIAYEDRFFFYRSRWIELTRNSRNFQQRIPVYGWEDSDGNPEQDPPFWTPGSSGPVEGYWWQPLDRGANYKVYGVRLGDWRFGFQESVVYINQSFYPEFFLSPLPMYFTQLFNTEGDFPWVQRDDENSHMGFFVDVVKPDWTAYFQFILGDMNLNFLAEEDRSHPQKWGWSLGGTRDTPVGRFGFYHAGATKYLFAATSVAADNYSTKRYEYAYWPAVEFPYKGTTNPIDYRDNYIGYLYGENNLAFMFTHEAQVNQWWVDSMAEFVVSGSKSPANPWHELRGHPGRFGNSNAPHYIHLLNESPLEWTFRLGTTVSRSFGPWDLTAKGMLGAVFNELELRAVPDEPPFDEQSKPEPRLYKPGDQNRLLFDFFLGVRYNFGISPRPEN
ncbi:MAG: hypothetical protein EA403_04830 [Spirochaetaceae bacterium]|nr:MAG: hypothetical protein EA403_04830 [Spirochaetaceae bacterium]